MKATISLELFEFDRYDRRDTYLRYSNLHIDPERGRRIQAWVAEIIGLDGEGKFVRSYLPGRTDYSRAKGRGQRGVFRYYILESGRVYDVAEQTDRARFDRYYCTVDEDGDIVRLEREEVRARLMSRAGGITSA
jgi:hypothetical protein